MTAAHWGRGARPGSVAHAAREALRVACLRERAIASLAEFVRGGWSVLEPSTPLTWGWHLDAVCAALEGVTREHRDGRAVDLVINIPPGFGKSLLVSVFWPAWQWLTAPGERTLHVANDDALAKRDSRRTRDLIASDWYAGLKLQATAPGAGGRAPVPFWAFADDQNEKINFANTTQGFRQCLAIGAKVTGKRADGLIVDDPIDAKVVVLGNAAQVARRVAEVTATFDSVLASRLNDQRAAYRVVIMQRLHPDDLAGVMLRRPGTRSLVLPMEYDPSRPDPVDPRTERGALLFPDRFPAEVVAGTRRAMGARHYLAQYQQSPTNEEGAVFSARWLRYHAIDGQRATFDEVAISVDAAFKGSADSDFVVMQVWGRRGADRYLLDQVRGRMTYTETRAALVALRRRWPVVRTVLIEDKANGSALIDDLRAVVPGVIGFEPVGSKAARASLAAVEFAAGGVHIPEAAAFTAEYVGELLAFPHGANDDQVDATGQILAYWAAKHGVDAVRDRWAWLNGKNNETR